MPDVKLVKPDVFHDPRGYFLETYSQQRYRNYGIDAVFVQDNLSRSVRGVLRGLHYQLEHPQGKLVGVVEGEVLDVAVDIRLGSPTFGTWVGAVLSSGNCHQLYIPEGFAHGFCVLSETARFAYKCTDYYHRPSERGIIWNDPCLKIDWRIDNPLISEKDVKYPILAAIPESDLPVYQG